MRSPPRLFTASGSTSHPFFVHTKRQLVMAETVFTNSHVHNTSTCSRPAACLRSQLSTLHQERVYCTSAHCALPIPSMPANDSCFNDNLRSRSVD